KSFRLMVVFFRFENHFEKTQQKRLNHYE
ncbi:MAG: hypothetical protein ACI85E_001976, partial [Marinomonas primoryensis]